MFKRSVFAAGGVLKAGQFGVSRLVSIVSAESERSTVDIGWGFRSTRQRIRPGYRILRSLTSSLGDEIFYPNRWQPRRNVGNWFKQAIYGQMKKIWAG